MAGVGEPADDGVTVLTQKSLSDALNELAGYDADVAAGLVRLGHPAPRTREPGFATLLRIIIAQQLSIASAAALWRKLELLLCGEVAPAGFLALDDAALRSCGFSAAKARYGRALAAAVASGGLAVEALAAMPDEEAVATLTALAGFGRWSAEVYLLFALGRADVFPADDLALQIAFQRLKRLDARPSGKALRTLVQAWAPLRGAGAVFLWHYYGAATLDERLAPAAVS